jgi:hypothetical protein
MTPARALAGLLGGVPRSGVVSQGLKAEGLEGFMYGLTPVHTSPYVPGLCLPIGSTVTA